MCHPDRSTIPSTCCDCSTTTTHRPLSSPRRRVPSILTWGTSRPRRLNLSGPWNRFRSAHAPRRRPNWKIMMMTTMMTTMRLWKRHPTSRKTRVLTNRCSPLLRSIPLWIVHDSSARVASLRWGLSLSVHPKVLVREQSLLAGSKIKEGAFERTDRSFWRTLDSFSE